MATPTAVNWLAVMPARSSICAVVGSSSSVWRLAECQLYSAISPFSPS